MATQLRPNWVTPVYDSPAPPAGLTFWDSVAQPVPAPDQSATVIRTWGFLQQQPNSTGGVIVFTLVDASVTDRILLPGVRQIGDAITVGGPDIDVLGDPLYIPFFLQWIDNASTQSGIYMIIFDADGAAGTSAGDALTSALLTVAP